jgi:hypothetical protein
MKKIEMDLMTKLMVVFFEYLSRSVNSHFAKLNAKKMTRVILKEMKEHGLVNLVHRIGSHPTWTATRKLIRATTKGPKEWVDHHPDFSTLIDRAATRICNREGEDGGVCPSDKWHAFELEFSAIFEYEYRNCLRWMKEGTKLKHARTKFSPEAFSVAWWVLMNAALNICAADYGYKLALREDDEDEGEEDGENCLSDATIRATTTASQWQSVSQNTNDVALPKPPSTTPA